MKNVQEVLGKYLLPSLSTIILGFERRFDFYMLEYGIKYETIMLVCSKSIERLVKFMDNQEEFNYIFTDHEPDEKPYFVFNGNEWFKRITYICDHQHYDNVYGKAESNLKTPSDFLDFCNQRHSHLLRSHQTPITFPYTIRNFFAYEGYTPSFQNGFHKDCEFPGCDGFDCARYVLGSTNDIYGIQCIIVN